MANIMSNVASGEASQSGGATMTMAFQAPISGSIQGPAQNRPTEGQTWPRLVKNDSTG